MKGDARPDGPGAGVNIVERMLGMRPRPPRGDAVRREVSGRIVVITGASRGIGAECARRFAAAGARVVLMARSVDALDAVATAIRAHGGEASTIAVDLREIDAAEAAAHRVIDEIGIPDVIISNAGHSIHRTLDEYADRAHDMTRVHGVNLHGPAALLRVLIPAMKSRGAGAVVAVSSVSAVVPAAGWSVYGSSKAAADAWFLAIAQEVTPEIAVSIVRLPLVRTKMIRATTAYERAAAMRPVDAAALIARAVVTGRRVLQPWWLPGAGALLALWPTALERTLRAQERRTRRG